MMGRGTHKKGFRKGFEDPMSISDSPMEYENKQNFGNLRMYNKRHLREHKKLLGTKFKEFHHTYGVRPTVITQVGNSDETIPELWHSLSVSYHFGLIMPN